MKEWLFCYRFSTYICTFYFSYINKKKIFSSLFYLSYEKFKGIRKFSEIVSFFKINKIGIIWFLDRSTMLSYVSDDQEGRPRWSIKASTPWRPSRPADKTQAITKPQISILSPWPPIQLPQVPWQCPLQPTSRYQTQSPSWGSNSARNTQWISSSSRRWWPYRTVTSPSLTSMALSSSKSKALSSASVTTVCCSTPLASRSSLSKARSHQLFLCFSFV